MHISIIGSGYVGLVSGAGLAEAGHHVMCMDIDEARIERLRGGEVPIHEPGLDQMIEHNAAEGRLQFTTSMQAAVDFGEILMIAVGTPPSEDGSADLSHVLDVARKAGELMKRPLLLVVKSTVPVGTCGKVADAVASALNARALDIGFQVASNPEFLAEGVAIKDFMKPDRIVIGVDSPKAEKLLRTLYAPFNRHHEKIICMDVRSSELTKYAANAMLATKISLMNELSNVAAAVGADIEHVRQGIGSDPRIGYSFIYPGPGYGGSCFPKDVRALAHTAQSSGVKPEILDAVEAVNNRQKLRLFELINQHFDGQLRDLTIAVWGLAFKPNTDDMREAPSRVLVEHLLDAGARVVAHDPEAHEEAARLFADRPGFRIVDDPYEATIEADALVMVTEWKQYWTPEFEDLRERMRQPVLFDGRNIWPEDMIRAHGFTCHFIGRPAIFG